MPNSKLFILPILALGCLSYSETPEPDRKVYVVGNAHLDTQWLWTIQETIDEHIKKTLDVNLKAFNDYPNYVFSWEGSFRYQMIKEYYPDRYEELKKLIAEGRWRVNGSWVDAVDCNIPSTESLMRHALLGNGFFRKEFGKSSVDVFLPDCFGFSYALPSVAVHCGLLGFSTQKLGWGSAYGIPFNIGMWQGVDGSRLISCIDPGSYTGDCGDDWDHAKWIIDRIDKTGKASGAYVDFRYHGAGDTGGGPSPKSLENLDKIMKANGPVKVLSTGVDQIFRDFSPEQIKGLPVFNNELLMTTHATGCYTSQTAMKEWNKKNEVLADAAERAAVVANLLTGEPYPTAKFDEAWTRFLWHQFHDDLTGTSIPQAYEFSWNDELISLNQFSDLLSRSISAWSTRMNTQGEGLPVLVYNATDRQQNGLVEAWVPSSKRWSVVLPNNQVAPTQVLQTKGSQSLVAFKASVPGVGLTVYRLVSKPGTPVTTDLKSTNNSIENNRLIVKVDDNGDVSSIYDKKLKREMLKAPIRLALLDNESRDWGAWEIKYEAVKANPRTYVKSIAKPMLVQAGPLKAVIQSKANIQGSTYVMEVSLAAGDTNQVDFNVNIDWKTKGTLLKAVVPANLTTPEATYDIGLGSIKRGVNRPELYEVPAQEWADLSSSKDKCGLAVLSAARYGWDRPVENTLRLTLIHTPNGKGNWDFQDSNDLGQHSIKFAVVSHDKDWRNDVRRSAAFFNRPFQAFNTTAHAGDLGKSYGFANVTRPDVSLRALKMAQDGKSVVARVYEDTGKAIDKAAVKFALPVTSTEALLGDEMPNPNAKVKSAKNGVTFALKPYGPMTFGVKLNAKPTVAPIASKQVELPFSFDCTDKSIDVRNHTVPATLWPATVRSNGLDFAFAPSQAANVLSCSGQTIQLPANTGNRVSLIMAATDIDLTASSRDITAQVIVDGKPMSIKVPAISGWHGSWWNRLATGKFSGDPEKLGAPILNRTPLAHVITHLNKADGTHDTYKFGYLYRIDIQVPANAKSIQLPNDTRILVFSGLRWNDTTGVSPATELYN